MAGEYSGLGGPVVPPGVLPPVLVYQQERALCTFATHNNRRKRRSPSPLHNHLERQALSSSNNSNLHAYIHTYVVLHTPIFYIDVRKQFHLPSQFFSCRTYYAVVELHLQQVEHVGKPQHEATIEHTQSERQQICVPRA